MAKSETTFYNLAELSEIASKAAKAINSVSERLEAIERHIGIAKDEPKLDRWYKRAGRSLVYLTGITRGVGYGYGFDIDGNWFDRCNGNPIFIDCLVEATPQEVEEALVKEAKRRGFLTQGTFFKSFTDGGKVREVQPFECYDGKMNPIKLSFSSGFLYYEEGLKTSYGLCSNPRVFEDGKWAEIVNQPVDKFAELKEAHKKGEVIQVRYSSGDYWHDCDYPRWDSCLEYRIKPEEKPKVGDVCKFWDDGENKYVVSVLTKTKEGDNYPYHTNFDSFKYATTITKEEAINLLFGNQ
ncbi:hypothetical protein BC792_12758 [Sphingobacterium allocomposti]|uniref:Uncharacterized protein n=1 Tax=Sphingobacterium allocomposti TaxID=415956 RepID=A0A5S5D093_9SPHI|nr:hypothetical protein [Sphingobacterium composti Yoo et al. 2007 non Ten et al. 2007]TYP89457.1 hypothetical protein BC792_12758 [Sphingobacterium composti Yoo et al. 2007 non Ten et al. 2007]